MLTRIESVLKEKGYDVWSVSSEAPVYEAIQLMAEQRVEALPVTSGSKLVGIVAERDCARRVTLQGADPKKVRVSEIMTSPVVFVTPAHTVGDCMRIVTDQGVTHLPVLEGETMVGVVSIGDLVKSLVGDQDRTIKHLEGYITGQYPG